MQAAREGLPAEHHTGGYLGAAAVGAQLRPRRPHGARVGRRSAQSHPPPAPVRTRYTFSTFATVFSSQTSVHSD